MGSIISAIYDDIEKYESLCKFYFEKPVKDRYGVDPYCEHAQELRQRHINELRQILTNQQQ
jgi:hypothetical protein